MLQKSNLLQKINQLFKEINSEMIYQLPVQLTVRKIFYPTTWKNQSVQNGLMKNSILFLAFTINTARSGHLFMNLSLQSNQDVNKRNKIQIRNKFYGTIRNLIRFLL